MLHSISWQHYLTAVVLLTAAWYAYVGLRYYPAELLALFRKKTEPMQLVASVPMHAVIGGIQAERDNQSHDAEELQFGPADPDEISDTTLPKGPADDLIAEATTLASASGTKADFLSLLQVLLDKYEIYRGEISLPAFTAQLLSLRLPFELTENELDLHWPAENYA